MRLTEASVKGRTIDRARTVRWVSEERVGLVTMNRPDKLNALNWDLFEDMKETLRAADVENAPPLIPSR